MNSRPYRRRFTGELAIDPALHELVMCTGALLDRLLCGSSSPILEALPPPWAKAPAPSPATGGGAAGSVRGGGHGAC